MRWLSFMLLGALAAAGSIAASNAPEEKRSLFVVVGASGEDEFGEQFNKWADLWRETGEKAHASLVEIGRGAAGEKPDLEILKQRLSEEPKEGGDLWLVLIGHGTFDGKEAKFNLRGPDLSSLELASWLQGFQRQIVIVNASSSSGPFINHLSAKNRAIVTAAKSGYEQNFARFGRFFSEGIGSLVADLDKDGQVSLLEAFLFGSRHATEFYEQEGRLATEHALLDDNGDKAGTPADWFHGFRAVKKASNGAVDGFRAHQIHLIRSDTEEKLSPEQRQKRDDLEAAIAALRENKKSLGENEYYQQLEKLLVELAEIYEPPATIAPPLEK